MIDQKLKLQNHTSASAIVKSIFGDMEIRNASIFVNKESEPDNTILMVIQDRTNPKNQIHIKLEKN